MNHRSPIQASGCTGRYVPEDRSSTNSATMTIDDPAGECTNGDMLVGLISQATAFYEHGFFGENTIEKGIAYKDAGIVYGSGAVFAGSTTDAKHFFWAKVATADRHKGIAGSGLVIDPPNIANSHVFDIQTDYTILEGFEITGWYNDDGTNSFEAVHVEATGVKLNGLLIHDDEYTGINPNADAINLNNVSTGGTVTIRNTRIYNISRSGILSQTTANTFNLGIYNCTVYNTAMSGAEADGEGGITISATTGVIIIRNTISMSKEAESCLDFSSAAGFSGLTGNNFSSDLTAPGGESFFEQVPETNFLKVTYKAENLHLRPQSKAVDGGVPLVGWGSSVDIDGDLHGPTWDIGADEIPDGG